MLPSTPIYSHRLPTPLSLLPQPNLSLYLFLFYHPLLNLSHPPPSYKLSVLHTLYLYKPLPCCQLITFKLSCISHLSSPIPIYSLSLLSSSSHHPSCPYTHSTTHSLHLLLYPSSKLSSLTGLRNIYTQYSICLQ